MLKWQVWSEISLLTSGYVLNLFYQYNNTNSNWLMEYIWMFWFQRDYYFFLLKSELRLSGSVSWSCHQSSTSCFRWGQMTECKLSMEGFCIAYLFNLLLPCFLLVHPLVCYYCQHQRHKLSTTMVKLFLSRMADEEHMED